MYVACIVRKTSFSYSYANKTAELFPKTTRQIPIKCVRTYQNNSYKVVPQNYSRNPLIHFYILKIYRLHVGESVVLLCDL